ncbi:DUF3793 family protein [Mogibacterium pumilum]|uniref:Cell surface protein n=1 Tax=Mogibacterium pumilum TaxID=86332 RepID=A0A223ASF4_9FIRM|nr:DUF3793 family protein [Mogibacterium pumilum]ASS37903.1 hypothetical protein AXF17_05295 [Mogibacterium pumilum]
MLEDKIIQFCAPTLARIKIGSMFGYTYASQEVFKEELCTINRTLNRRGVNVVVLQDNGRRALLYVFRPEMLKKRLTECCVMELMHDFGYQNCNMAKALHRLRNRISMCGSFPHEVGIFLGYPVDDVAGFINHCGNNCKVCGQWKVYGDVEYAKNLFAKYKRCERIYMKRFKQNGDIAKLTVCA